MQFSELVDGKTYKFHTSRGDDQGKYVAYYGNSPATQNGYTVSNKPGTDQRPMVQMEVTRVKGKALKNVAIEDIYEVVD